jgi:hypothetical protein
MEIEKLTFPNLNGTHELLQGLLMNLVISDYKKSQRAHENYCMLFAKTRTMRLLQHVEMVENLASMYDLAKSQLRH